MNFPEYTTKKIGEVFKELKTSENGLSSKQVENLIKVYGFNEIKAKKTTLFDVFLRQFKSPFFYLLFIASVIAFLMGEEINALAILFFVAINIFLGFFQEARAEKAIALLKKYLPSTARVLREGTEKTIDKKFLVPGDIVLLEAGDIVPADLRVLRVENFLIDESVLTGESVPVSKNSQPLLKEAKEIFEAANILWAGTSLVSGEAEGIVIGTGRNTAIGEIAKLVSKITRESSYEKELLKLSKFILRIVLITIVFVFLANLAIKGTTNFFDFLIFSIALVVSIIPEALPLVVTFALSNGALKLAKEKVVVKRLSALEDLGNIEILCTDKTGTLTENKIVLEKIFARDEEKCLLYALLASSYAAEKIESSLNPFDAAIFKKSPLKIREALKDFKTISESPFDPFKLRNSVFLKSPKGKSILIVKGAPEAILKLSSRFEDSKTIEEIKKEIEEQGRAGRRTLAIAYKEFNKDYFTPLHPESPSLQTGDEWQIKNSSLEKPRPKGRDVTGFTAEDENNLIFLGYFSFRDPLKKTAKESMSLAKKLGLQIKILTGDSREVAGAVAKEINLVDNPRKVIIGEELDSLSEEEFEKTCEEFSVFARVSPTTKYNIIRALQRKYAVGFLGEGINDTPSLKLAQLSMVVDSAADVSREVSDIILLEKDLKLIIDGIKQGRNIFSNINKYIKCTLASNFGNFYSIAVISLFITFLPMLPVQILLVNFLSDFPLVAVASDKIDIEELRRPKLYQLNKFILLIIFLAIVSTIFDFIFFGIFHKIQPAQLRTLWFIESILTEIILIFSIRTSHLFAKAKMPSLSLLFISIFTVLITIILPLTHLGQNIFHLVSPSLHYVLIVISLVIAYFLISEVVKLLYFRHKYKSFKVN